MSVITAGKLERWSKLRHRRDVYDRLRDSADVVTYEECITLDDVAARLRLASSAIVSREFKETPEALLKSLCENEHVASRLRELAHKPHLGAPPTHLLRARSVSVVAASFIWLGALLPSWSGAYLHSSPPSACSLALCPT